MGLHVQSGLLACPSAGPEILSQIEAELDSRGEAACASPSNQRSHFQPPEVFFIRIGKSLASAMQDSLDL
jgi:hypothetical protein